MWPWERSPLTPATTQTPLKAHLPSSATPGELRGGAGSSTHPCSRVESQALQAAASQPGFLEAACTGEPLLRCHSHSQHTFCHCGEQNKLKILGAPDWLGESSAPLQKDGKILPIPEFCQDHSTPATCRHTLLVSTLTTQELWVFGGGDPQSLPKGGV